VREPRRFVARPAGQADRSFLWLIAWMLGGVAFLAGAVVLALFAMPVH
jgi:hypothetical protein